MDQKNTFQTFENLEVYQAARAFRNAMYQLVKRLPDCEKFCLIDQIRRAALSLTNNIAEGHGRYYYLDQIRFMLISRGSLEELVDDLNHCSDQNYIPEEEIASLKDQASRISQLIGGYIRFLRKCKAGENLSLRDESNNYATSEDCDDLIGVASSNSHYEQGME